MSNSADCSLPGSSVHGIFQVRLLEWVAVPSSGDLPDPGIEPTSSAFPELQVDYSLVAQMVKHLPAMWETWVPCLGGDDPLEKEMATHSSVLAWEIPWTEEPCRL